MTTLPLGLTLTAARRRAILGAALAIAAFALGADAAAAATAYVETAGQEGQSQTRRVVFTAGGSERNNVSVSVSGSQYTVADSGATVSAGSGCTLLSAGRVRCSVPGSPPISSVRVSTGDLDDTVTVAGAVPVVLDGGTGADNLRGGDAADQLYGGPGDDVLDGGLGADFITGSDGRDRVDYSARTAPVTVSLSSWGGDGQAGEGDIVWWGVEDVTGGSGNDVLTGNPGPNTLDGGAGRDVLDGGAGADKLASRDGEADDNRCGADNDSVTGDYLDVLAADCEVRDLTAKPAASPAPARAVLDMVPATVRLTSSGKIRIRVGCPRGGDGCEGVVTAAIVEAGQGRRRIRAVHAAAAAAGTRFVLRAGESEVFKVKISRNGRRRVIRDKKASCKISAVTRSGGRSSTASKTVVVKSPRKTGGR